MSKDIKPKKQMKTALLICALTSITPAFGVGPKAMANSSTPPSSSILQQRQVATGRVLDNQGEPLIGVTVMEAGTSNGTVTDLDGKFSLNLKNPNAKLAISYVGYISQTLQASGNMKVTLKPDNKELSEIVVVGYGTQKKVNLTGSVSSVDSKVLESRPIQNLQSGLQGLMPGVTISGTNGAPGMDAGSINVRGVGTLNTSSPYILIDGVESGTMSSLDPNDIESISVLKDAASAAIYGSKAANGVILITTKRGKSGKPQVSYNGYISLQNPTSLVDRLDSYEYAHMLNDALESEGKAKKFATEEEINALPNTDWYDLAYKTGSLQHHNVSVNGATDNVNYLASVGYLKQTGILPHAGREQFNGRTNLEMKINSRLTARLNLSFIKNDYSDPSSAYNGGGSDQIIRQLNLIAPWITARYDDGTWGTISDGSPIAWLDNGLKVNRKNTNFTGLLGVDYKILDGLTAKLSASYVNDNQNYSYFQKYFVYNANKKTDPNFLDDRLYKWERKTFEALLTYNKTFGKHSVGALAGWHAEGYDYKYSYAYRQNFPNNEVTDLNAGDVSTQKAQGYTRELNMLSWFGRVNYDFAGRYLFEANLRADASSRFADGHRWGYFPSFSAGWRVSEEPFMEATKSWLSNFKIRASWGQLGNQEALSDYYPSISTYSVDAKYPFDNKVNTGYYQSSYKINTITWEKATTWGIGVDLGFLNGKINTTIDYYNRLTDGILISVDAPYEFALGSYLDNVGKMRNQGVEFSLGYNDKFGDVTFGAALNVAYNKNKIESMPGKGYVSTGYNQRNATGEEYNSYYVYKADGFFNSDEEAKQYMDYYWPADGSKGSCPFGGGDFKGGDLKYVDTNGDGKIDDTDRIYAGSSVPRWTFGLNLNAAWKGFDLSLFFNGQFKAYRYFDAYEVEGAFVGDSSHPATIWRDSWTYNKTNPKMPRLFTNTNSPSSTRNNVSTFWLKNVSYCRLKNLQFGYTLPKSALAFLHVNKVRVYYSCENLFTIDGLDINVDPEATSQRLSSYPLLRTHSFGLSVTF
ncbi:MAG TPA: SusC/RagA family TonB-linked outer membrane protein [Prevotella sp.]|nr:SusC/RagA family TonB-linked outer membrane protein [Prevotella sp.]